MARLRRQLDDTLRARILGALRKRWLVRLAGAWPDFPAPEELRQHAADDVPREPL